MCFAHTFPDSGRAAFSGAGPVGSVAAFPCQPRDARGLARSRPPALPSPEVWVCWRDAHGVSRAPGLWNGGFRGARSSAHPPPMLVRGVASRAAWPPGPPSASVRAGAPATSRALTSGGARAPVCAGASQGAVFSECEDAFPWPRGCLRVKNPDAVFIPH